MALVKIAAHELALDKPTGFRVYSAAGKLLLSEGHLLRSETQLERLLTNGAFREDNPRGANPDKSCTGHAALLSTASHTTPRANPASAVVTCFPVMPTSVEVFHLSPSGNADVSFRADYVGAVKDRALLVIAPDSAAMLQPGAELEAKVICGREVYSFHTRVAGRDALFPGVISLDYPAEVRKRTIRQHLRLQTHMSARLIRNDVVATGFDAEVLNIGANGIGFFLPDTTLERGEHFKLALRLKVDRRNHALMLNCIARNVAPLKGGMKVGAEFGALTDDVRSVVQRHIFELATGASQ
ncbi:PilZ domain-containing protein [Caballeronia sp. DA-9]|uniref:PilZ domain-containing protein n=1 Tax=Caballeronia sp. DA-9 TaxID=3436237 RepID=UPI003F674544